MGVLNTTPTTWVSGAVPPAADFNREIRDALTNLQSAWTSYTPALTAVSVNPTLGSGGALTGQYQQLGKIIMGNAQALFGASGTAAGTGRYALSLPVAAVTSFIVVGHGYFLDSSGPTTLQVEARLLTATTFALYLDNQTAGTLGLGAAAPVAVGANDQINVSFFYQAA